MNHDTHSQDVCHGAARAGMGGPPARPHPAGGAAAPDPQVGPPHPRSPHWTLPEFSSAAPHPARPAPRCIVMRRPHPAPRLIGGPAPLPAPIGCRRCRSAPRRAGSRCGRGPGAGGRALRLPQRWLNRAWSLGPAAAAQRSPCPRSRHRHSPSAAHSLFRPLQAPWTS